IEYDGQLKPTLSKAGLVTRDAREVERKKGGLHKARRRKKFSKRCPACRAEAKGRLRGGLLLFGTRRRGYAIGIERAAPMLESTSEETDDQDGDRRRHRIHGRGAPAPAGRAPGGRRARDHVAQGRWHEGGGHVSEPA